MRNELNINNSKKIIIGVSILFCTVILIIGGTIAYFTQSDTKEIGNIVSANQVTLEYNDSDNTYMLGDLIPINVLDVETAYNREDNLKCKDDNGYNVCSIYRFTISNTSDVTQKLVVNMLPTLNSFHNLKFNVYEINNGISSNVKKNQSLTYDDKTPINLFTDLTLNNRSSKTYEIVYYILNKQNEDQTMLDAGKKFGAQITINSVTTGEYVSKEVGASCYKILELSNNNSDTTYFSENISQDYYGTHILTEFYGIDETDPENPKPVEGCGVTQDDNGFYSVTVPSKIGDKEISTLGNTLFKGINEDFGPNEKSKIKYVEIEDGVKIIEDGDSEEFKGTFAANGIYISEETCELFDNNTGACLYGFDFNIKLPNILKHIGSSSFVLNNIKKINIPSSVEIINAEAFGGDPGAYWLSSVIFERDKDGNSNLKTIGSNAFSGNLTNQLDENGEIIPFIIPKSVEYIRSSAFNGNKLIKILFEVDEEGNSNLKTIESNAFYNNNLTYETSPLIIPANVETIGQDAFYANENNINSKLLKLEYKGTSESILNNTTNWYNPDYTKLNDN